jgi:hypothetical protein
MLSYPRWRIDLFYAQLLLDDAMLLDSIPSVPDQPRSMIKKLHNANPETQVMLQIFCKQRTPFS